ncbi:MAG: MFS transporter [Gammaproteobacteria bacterium]|nr:MFS transporter [Gammaproteobacteria bacterium]
MNPVRGRIVYGETILGSDLTRQTCHERLLSFSQRRTRHRSSILFFIGACLVLIHTEWSAMIYRTLGPMVILAMIAALPVLGAMYAFKVRDRSVVDLNKIALNRKLAAGPYGWAAAVTVAASLLLIFSIPGILRREPPPPPAAARRRARGERPSLLTLLRRPDTRLVLPLVALLSFGGALIPNLYIAYLVDMGFTVKDIGPLILAPATLVGTLIGSSLTVWFLNRFGYKTTILLSACLMIPTVIPIIWMGSLSSPTLLIVFLVTLNGIILPSFLGVAAAASRLKWSSKTQAATDYTALIVTASAAASAALGIGGVLAEHLGWYWYFVFTGTFVTACCFVFYFMFDRIEAIVDARDASELEEHAA